MALLVLFTDNSKFPSNFEKDFLGNTANKVHLNEYLAKKFIALHGENEQILCVTFQNTVLSNQVCVMSENDIAKCTSEEADARMVRHAINLGKQSFKHVVIRTVDSDVVVLTMANAEIARTSGVTSFFLIYGLAGQEKYLNVFEVSVQLGKDVCKGLPFFHALSGCDTVSSFYNVGKARFWSEWMKTNAVSSSLTEAFIYLSNEPTKISQDMIRTISEYIYRIYVLGAHTLNTFPEKRVHHLTKTAGISIRALVMSEQDYSSISKELTSKLDTYGSFASLKLTFLILNFGAGSVKGNPLYHFGRRRMFSTFWQF